MPRYELELFADYFQFYVQDDDEQYGDLSDAWTEEAVQRLLAVAEHAIGIGTVRNMDVPVFIEASDRLPVLEPTAWDRINETSIICDTGRLVVAGCTDYFPDAFRIYVKPGSYDVIVAYRNLDEIAEDGLDGEDCYYIFLAPSHTPTKSD